MFSSSSLSSGLMSGVVNDCKVDLLKGMRQPSLQIQKQHYLQSKTMYRALSLHSEDQGAIPDAAVQGGCEDLGVTDVGYCCG